MNQAAVAPVAAATARGGDQWLGGWRVLVIRPAGQGGALVGAIRSAGGEPIELPTLDILPVGDTTLLDASLSRVDAYDLVIFVSVNAVIHFALRAAAIGAQGLTGVRCAAAPGPATAAQLSRGGARSVIVPRERFDSEGLIEALREGGAPFRHALIVRGSGGDDRTEGSGRELLADWLHSQGACVESVAAYLRRPAGLADAQRSDLLAGPPPAALLVSSSEGGRQLVAMLGESGRAWLAGAEVFVPHERIAMTMRQSGFSAVHVTAGGDAGLMRGLERHVRGVSS